jgi:hypothetical protein
MLTIIRATEDFMRSPSDLQDALYGSVVEAAIVCSVPSRRLDDRIRELCAMVCSAENHELEPLITELRSALHEHNQRLRKLAVAKLGNSLVSRRGAAV